MNNNGIKFSDDFCKIHFTNHEHNGTDLSLLSDDGYLKRGDDIHLLYGDIVFKKKKAI